MQHKRNRRPNLELTVLLLFSIGRYNPYNQQIFPTYWLAILADGNLIATMTIETILDARFVAIVRLEDLSTASSDH